MFTSVVRKRVAGMFGAGVFVAGSSLLFYFRERRREDIAVKSLFLKNLSGDVIVTSEQIHEENDDKSDCSFSNTARKNQRGHLYYFHSKNVVNNLKERLHQKITTSGCGIDYMLLYGEPGQGKTTITNQLAKENGFKKIEIKSTDSAVYAMQMAKDLGIGERYDTSTLTGIWTVLKLLPVAKKPTPNALLDSCFSAIERGAAEFREKRGIVPVLIVDGLDNLIHSREGKEHLLRLQMKCKEWADKKIVKVVLVSGDHDTTELLHSKEQSIASSMEFCHLGDLGDDEIVPFIKSILPVELHNRLESAEVKNAIEKVTGGRIRLLVRLARAVARNRVSEFSTEIVSLASYQLKDCGLPGPNQCDVAKLGNSIIKHADTQGFASRKVTAIVSAELEEKLLHYNVLAMCYEDDSIGFSSRAHETAFKMALKDYEVK